MLRTKRAFTLIELLVVIAIIGVLAGLLMPVISRAQGSAQKAADLNNLKQIGTAAMLYARDNRRFPHYGDGSNGIAGENDWDGALVSVSLLVREKFIDNTEVFISPASTMDPAEQPDWENKDELAEFTLVRWNCSYGWSKRVMKPGKRSTFPLSATAYIDVELDADIEGGDAVDPNQCFDDGINVLYVDGHVDWVPLSDNDELSTVVERLVISENLEAFVDE